jgi:hypothetical protein
MGIMGIMGCADHIARIRITGGGEIDELSALVELERYGELRTRIQRAYREHYQAAPLLH